MYLTVPEVADRLRISVSSAYALVEMGRLAHHRVGARNGAIRVSEEDLAQYESDCRREPELKRPTLRPAARRVRLRDIQL